MNECRCVFCGRYLFSFEITTGESKITIKCKNCGNLNAFRFEKVTVTVTNYTFAGILR